MIEHREIPRALSCVADEFVNIERLNDVFLSAILVVKDTLGKVSVLVFDGEKFSALVNRAERLKYQNIPSEPKELIGHFGLAVKRSDTGGFIVASDSDKASDILYAYEAATLMNLFIDENSAIQSVIDFLDNNKYF